MVLPLEEAHVAPPFPGCALGLAFVAAAIRGGRLSQVFQFQKTRITQEIPADEMKESGLGHLKVAATGLFQAAAGWAGDVGRGGEGVRGDHCVAELAEEVGNGARECGTSTVLVRSLAAISFSVSKYWVIRTSCMTS